MCPRANPSSNRTRKKRRSTFRLFTCPACAKRVERYHAGITANREYVMLEGQPTPDKKKENVDVSRRQLLGAALFGAGVVAGALGKGELDARMKAEVERRVQEELAKRAHVPGDSLGDGYSSPSDKSGEPHGLEDTTPAPEPAKPTPPQETPSQPSEQTPPIDERRYGRDII